MNKDFNRPLIIIGMHRSGTTMLTKILIDCGWDFGRSLSPNLEDRVYQNLNRMIMRQADGHWANPQPVIRQLENVSFRNECISKIKPHLLDQQETTQPWGWKDPRTTVTLPIWMDIYPDAKIIHIIRNGIDASMSLFRREIGRYFHKSIDARLFPPTFRNCFLLWNSYVRIGRQWGSKHPHYLEIHYEDIQHQPWLEFQKLDSFLNTTSFTDINKVTKLIRAPTDQSKILQLIVKAAWKYSIKEEEKELMSSMEYSPANR